MEKFYKRTLMLFVLLFAIQNLQAATWYVRKNAAGDGKTPNNAFGTLSAAIAASSGGDIIDIGTGTFNESGLVVNKQLTIQGTKKNTEFSNTGGTFITFTANGTPGNRMVIKNINLSGYARAFVDVPSYSTFSLIEIYGSNSNSAIWGGNVVTFADGATDSKFEYIDVDGYWERGATGAYDPNSGNGAIIFKVPDGYSASNLSFVKVLIDNAGVGFYASQTVNPAGSAMVSSVSFTNCIFNNLKSKGIYAEKLSGLNITGSSFENVGQTTSGHPAAIDINLKWQNFTGNVSVSNSSFVRCGVPNSGTDVNGAAVLIKTRDFGSYAAIKATWVGDASFNRCYFGENNAGIRIGESNNGDGTAATQNAAQTGTVTVANSVFSNNDRGTAGTYNHFDIRNVATANMNINNTYFFRNNVVQNPTLATTFAVNQVSDVNTNGGTTNINANNVTGPYLAELTAGNFTPYANFAAAFAAVPANGNLYVLTDLGSSGGLPAITTSKSFSLYYPMSPSDYENNIVINGGAEFTLYGNFEFDGSVIVNNGKMIVPDYQDFYFSDLTTATGSLHFVGDNGFASIGGSAPLNLPKITGTPLYLEADGEFTLAENLTVKNFIAAGGSDFNVGNFTLTILEDIIGTGNIASTTGTVKFSGTGTIAKLDTEIEIKDLIIDRATGLELITEMTINGTLSLKNGDFYLSTGELTLGPTFTYDNSGVTGGLIIVDKIADGEVEKVYNAANPNFIFPMGAIIAGVRTSLPVTINLNPATTYLDNNLGYISLKFAKGLSGNAPGATTKHAGYSWQIMDENLGSLSYNVTFGYNESTFNGGLTEAELVPYRYSLLTNPVLKRYTAGTGLVKNTATNILSFTDTKLGEFMFLADNGTTPTTSVDFPVVNTNTQKGFTTIQAAINDSQTLDGQTIEIAGGTYIERVSVTKSLTFKGNNAGVDPWNWIKPATIIKTPNTNFTAPSNLFSLSVANVTIDGIAFEGTNDLLSDATPNTINGKANRVSNGIGRPATSDNSGYRFEHNSFTNFSGRGISLAATNEQQSSLFINNNSFDNIIGINANAAIGILTTNFSGEMKQNRFTRCNTAMQPQFNIAAFGSLNISNNQISAYRIGIRVFGTITVNAPSVTVANNTIDLSSYASWTADGFTAPAINSLNGIYISSFKGDNPILLEGNTISNVANGLLFEGIQKSVSNPDRLLVKNGTILNANIGINYYNTSNTSFATRLVVSGLTVTDSQKIGILNENENATGFASELVLRDGVLINHPSTVPATYNEGIQIFGVKAILNELNNTKISTARLNFINVNGNAMTGQTVNADNVTFDGTVNGQTFTNYKPSAGANSALRTAVKLRIYDGEDTGNTASGIVVISDPLPVSLLSFTAVLKSQGAVLNWSTATETNNRHFVIEKRLEGTSFAPIATITGKNNSTTLSAYEYVDANFTSSAYYRIKQVDFNGDEKIYDDLIRFVKGLNEVKLSIYPNPTTSKINLKTTDNTQISASLMDLYGRLLQTKTGFGNIEFDVQNLSPGIYLVKSGNESYKIIKQ